jgi:hypothetical protein
MANSSINIRERGAYTGERTAESPFQGTRFGTDMGNSGFLMNRHIAILRLASNPNNSDTITLGSSTYTFKTNPTTAAQIEIGNLIKEGTFARDGVHWSNYGNWTIGSSKATHVAGILHTEALEQNWFKLTELGKAESVAPSPEVIVGGSYVVDFTTTGIGAGSVTVYVGGVAGTPRSTNNTFTETIVAANTDSLKFVPTADFDGAVSAITVTKSGTDLKGLTAKALVNKINEDQTNTKCSALYAALQGGTTYIVLVQESVDIVHPTITVDGARIVLDTDWTTTLTEAKLESTTYWYKDKTVEGDSKPTVLVERNSGTDRNFLY